MRIEKTLEADLKRWIGLYPNVIGYSAELKEEIRDGKPTGRIGLRVYVSKKKAEEELVEGLLPDEYGGYVVDVIELGEVRAFGSAPEVLPSPKTSGNAPFVDPTKRYRPIFGGISVGHYAITAGTISAIVRSTAGDGKIGILSNNHVLADENKGKSGDAILQPGAYDGGTVANDTIATLSRFVPVQFDNPLSGCPNAAWVTFLFNSLSRLLGRRTRLVAKSIELSENEVDCAFAELAEGISYTPAENGLFVPVGVSEAADNDVVIKSGRTTGVTRGTVIDTAGTVNVGYGGTNVATFVNQLIITDLDGKPFSQGGDSGSLIIRESDQAAVGLLFAGGQGSTIGNHIGKVLDALKLEIVTE
jgi:hypothetical protein